MQHLSEMICRVLEHNSLVTYLLKLMRQDVSRQAHIVISPLHKNELRSSFRTYSDVLLSCGMNNLARKGKGVENNDVDEQKASLDR